METDDRTPHAMNAFAPILVTDDKDADVKSEHPLKQSLLTITQFGADID